MIEEPELPRAYEIQAQRSKEQNDSAFLSRDIELRKWCVQKSIDSLQVQVKAFHYKELYEFITSTPGIKTEP